MDEKQKMGTVGAVALDLDGNWRQPRPRAE